MRRRGISALACALTGILGGLLALPAASASAATANSPVPLPQLGSFHQILADPSVGSGYLFFSTGQSSYNLISNGPQGGGIVVTSLSGTYITTIDGTGGVEGMALSPHGSTLYAALSKDSAVAAINVSSIASGSPAETDYSLPSGDVPYALALQSGKLWVSYNIVQNGTPTAGESAVGDFPLPSTTFEPQSATGGWYSAPELGADPSGSGVLVATQSGISPTEAASYNVAADPVTVTAKTGQLSDANGNDNCDYATGVAVLNGGASFAVSCGNEYATGSMGFQGSILGSGAIATDTDGVLVAATREFLSQSGTFQSQVSAYRSGSATPVNQSVIDSSLTPAPGGVAVVAGDSNVYAVVQPQGSSSTYELLVLPNLTRTQATLSLQANPASLLSGHGTTLTGTLTLGGGQPLPAGTTVTITRTDPAGATTTTSVTPAANGAFSLADNPLLATGSYTYTASYAGVAADNISPATATATVTVARDQAKLTLRGARLVTFGRHVTVHGTLSLATGAPATGTVVRVTRTKKGSTAVAAFTEHTGTGGGFTVANGALPKGTYTYRASYAGTASNTPATATRTVTVARTRPSLKIITSHPRYRYGTRVTVTVKLGATFSDRWVSLYAKPNGRGKTRVAHGRVNSRGELSVRYRLWRTTRFTAVFGGDVHNAPVTVSRLIGSLAIVRMWNGGYFKTTKIKGVSYRVYHHTGHLDTAVKVFPDKHGECIRLVAQEFDPAVNRWITVNNFGCFTLNKHSQMVGYLTLRHAAGHRYRLTAVYIRSSRDTANLDARSNWFYFKVVR